MKMNKKTAWIVIAVVGVVTALAALQLPHLEVVGGTVFLPENHPATERLDRMEEIFGGSEIVSVMMRLERGSVFTPETLALVARMTAEFETIEGVERVTSLSNMDYMVADGGDIRIEKLMPEPARTAQEAAEVERRATSWELYRRVLFSDDLRSTQWVLMLEPSPKGAGDETGYVSGIVRAVRNVIAKYEGEGRTFHFAGETPVNIMLVEGITRDMVFLLPLLVAVLMVVLYLSFRTVAGVVLPLLTVGVSTVWTVGLMAALGVPFNILGTTVPLLLVTVGSAYGIHFLSHYYSVVSEDPDLRTADAVGRTFRTAGSPILLAAVTTMFGFGSLAAGSIPAIRDMGVFTAIGVVSALVLTFTLVPALLILRKGRMKLVKAADSGHGSRIETLLPGLYTLFERRRFVLYAITGLLCLVSGLGISRITVGQPTVNFFRKSSEVRRAAEFADEQFGGITVMNVIVSAQDGGPRTGEPAVSNSGQIAQAGAKPDAGFSSDSASSEPASGEPFDLGFDLDFDLTGSGGSAVPDDAPAGSEPSSGSGAVPDDLFDFDLTGQAAAGNPGASSDSSAAGPAPAGNPGTGDGETKLPGTVADPAVLAAIDGLERHLAGTFDEVGAIASITAMLKQMNRVMHDGDPGFYEIPADPEKYGLADRDALRRLVAQYLLLYSGNLSEFIDSMDAPARAKITVQLRDGNPAFIKRVRAEVLSYAAERFEPLGFTVEVAGSSEQMIAMNDMITRSQLLSIAFAFPLVFLVLLVSYRSAAAGLLGVIPIALSLLINFGVMGFFGIPLDIVTAMIASIAIGIGIDYAIHVTSVYEAEYRIVGDHREAARRMLRVTGKAILSNASSVALGFAVLVFSVFTPLNTVGILIAVIMFTSSFFSMTLLPVLFARLRPKFLTRTGAAGAVPTGEGGAEE